MDWKGLLLSAKGRIRRRDFWIGFAVCFVVQLISEAFGRTAVGLVSLLLVWPQACLAAKRLHDMGRSAWLMLIPAVVTVALSLLLTAAAISGSAGPVLLAVGVITVCVVSLGFLLWIGLARGQPGENRFGPPPPAPARRAVTPA